MQTNISRLLQTWSTFTFQRDDYNSKSDCRQEGGEERWSKGGAALYRVIKTNIFKFTRNQSNNHPSQAASSHHIRTWGHASPLGAHARVVSDNFETKSLNLHVANISIAMAHVFVFHKFVFFQCIFRFVCVCDLFPSKCAAHAQQRKTRGRLRARETAVVIDEERGLV